MKKILITFLLMLFAAVIFPSKLRRLNAGIITAGQWPAGLLTSPFTLLHELCTKS